MKGFAWSWTDLVDSHIVRLVVLACVRQLEKEEFVRWWLDRVLPPENYRRQQEVIAR
jgi:endonuclease III